MKILSKKHAIVVASNKTSKVLDGNVIENFLTKNPGKLFKIFFFCIFNFKYSGLGVLRDIYFSPPL